MVVTENGVFAGLLEKDAVIAAAESKADHRRPELFHVAVARGEVAVDAVENVEGGLAVNGAEVRLGFG